MIDLRSDTVTRPTEGMKEFMWSAQVGDDVFDEDPTVKELEQKAAEMFGFEAGIYCPSGTMTNQIGVKMLTSAPGEVICDQRAHIYNYEGGGVSFNAGLSMRLVDADDGILQPHHVTDNINPDDVHKPITQLVSIENTCNKAGGTIYNRAAIEAISETCRSNKLPLHVDGARVFNALVESGDSAKMYGELTDSVSICLSKGLGCPIGSVLVSSATNIKMARRLRKIFGGGMRQVGFLAAAGIYALDHHVDRLKEDHDNARAFASEIKDIDYIEKVYDVPTNIVIYQLKDSRPLETHLQQMEAKGVYLVPFGPQTVRVVTHHDVNREQLMEVAAILKSLDE